MNSDIHKDVQIIESIRKGGKSREQALATIFKNSVLRNKIHRGIIRQGGNIQDAEDMYQEAIIVLDRNIRQNKFRQESSLEAYLYSISKFLWKNQRRKNQRVQLTDEQQVMERHENNDPEYLYLEKAQKEALRKSTNELGENCRKILKLWQLSYSMKEIKEELGLSSEGMARKKKYECLKKLIALVEANKELKQYYP